MRYISKVWKALHMLYNYGSLPEKDLFKKLWEELWDQPVPIKKEEYEDIRHRSILLGRGEYVRGDIQRCDSEENAEIIEFYLDCDKKMLYIIFIKSRETRWERVRHVKYYVVEIDLNLI